MRVVTMLTDFGLSDSYVAQMKGVITDLCPTARIFDISHMVRRHDILSGAFLLETAVPFFPNNSIHLGVVDPGVGADRLPIVVKAKTATLIGPDNGLLERAARRLGVIAVYKIDVAELELGEVSSTFHGRDVFAKTTGMLASGLRAEDVGPPVKGLAKLQLQEAEVKGGILECRILHIDTFGNLITNAHNAMLRRLTSQGLVPQTVKSSSRSRRVRIAKTYSDARLRKLVVLEGSQGYVEVAAREADADNMLHVRAREKLRILFSR
ncbi:SAM-dependent chlorinase/fluorinase [Candidatus Bathyarchaeota archaeon]|nr:MAG: SAM-dependent chlorinase/fluorinase [Candidatus Bathyarchaeota archaeon]TMI31048.1 MAG: SAM-dependent chlorinase/fluorinase [Candidatus Bathyarchaeota archaeon]